MLASERFILLLAILLTSCSMAAAQCRCEGCGCKGGPGWRDGSGQCVSHKQLTQVCGNPPSQRCTFEGTKQVCPSERKAAPSVRSVFDPTKAMDELGLPLVVKIPDDSFSRDVHKVESQTEFKRVADELFEEADLLLAQKFLPTEFDWRVGVLAGEPLFVCQYRMPRGHWQIVKRRADGSAREGGLLIIEIEQAPVNVCRGKRTKFCSATNGSVP
jgi:hypothetical protein